MLTRLRQICCDPALCYENYDGGSAKLESCMELLNEAPPPGHKVLLFSQFTSMLEIIRNRLEAEGRGIMCCRAPPQGEAGRHGGKLQPGTRQKCSHLSQGGGDRSQPDRGGRGDSL